MQRTLTINLGIVIARESIEHPWQDHAWRPLEAFLNAPQITEWRQLRKGDGFVHYHAATLPLELHRKETPGYCENLDAEQPSLFVVLREADIEEEGGPPVDVHLVTASPHEVEAYGEDGSEIIAPGGPAPPHQWSWSADSRRPAVCLWDPAYSLSLHPSVCRQTKRRWTSLQSLM